MRDDALGDTTPPHSRSDVALSDAAPLHSRDDAAFEPASCDAGGVTSQCGHSDAALGKRCTPVRYRETPDDARRVGGSDGVQEMGEKACGGHRVC